MNNFRLQIMINNNLTRYNVAPKNAAKITTKIRYILSHIPQYYCKWSGYKTAKNITAKLQNGDYYKTAKTKQRLLQNNEFTKQRILQNGKFTK